MDWMIRKSPCCVAQLTRCFPPTVCTEGGDNLSPPFSKGWITFLHLFYIVRWILTIGKNLYYIHNTEVPLFSLGVPHCAYLLVFKYLYLLFLCHKYMMFCSKILQTCLQNLYAHFIISFNIRRCRTLSCRERAIALHYPYIYRIVLYCSVLLFVEQRHHLLHIGKSLAHVLWHVIKC